MRWNSGLGDLWLSADSSTTKQVYPDSGVAAMLQNSWKDGNYRISSLTDRLPVNEEDDLVVLAAPDPQGDFTQTTSMYAGV